MKTIVTLLMITLFAGCGKPNIEPTCVMNGWGSGKCEFLNSGDGDGSMEILITVHNIRTDSDIGSTTLKSGVIKAGDVRERQFLIPSVKKGCEADFFNDETWTDVCHFTVTPVDQK